MVAKLTSKHSGRQKTIGSLEHAKLLDILEAMTGVKL